MLAEGEATRPRLIPSTRFTLALLISFAFFTQYAQRISVSIAIVCMINKTNIDTASETTAHLTEIQNGTSTVIRKYGSELLEEKQFFWTEFQQQILLGAHWFGGNLSLIPGSWLSMKIGAKRTFLLGILLSSIASIMTSSLYFLPGNSLILGAILRVLVGVGHGPISPATYTVLSTWAVPLERGTLTSIGSCTGNLGTAVTMLMGGLFCRYITAGWVYIFVLSGVFGFIWLPLWLWLAADSPQSHPTIGERERKYICDHVGIDPDSKKTQAVSFMSLPWRKVIRSKPIIALFLTQFFNIFGLLFFFTNIGKLLTEILGFPPQNTGYVLAGGFILMPVTSLSTGIIADRLVRSKKMTLTNVRKLFNSLALFIPAVCMVVLCFCDHTQQTLGIIVVLIVLASSAMGYGSGYVVNFADVAPAYSSVIFAVSTTISAMGAISGNFIAGLIIKQPVLKDWQILYILFAITYTIGGIIFLIYGSAVPQEWATFKHQKSKLGEESQSLTPSSQQATNHPEADKSGKKQSIYLPE